MYSSNHAIYDSIKVVVITFISYLEDLVILSEDFFRRCFLNTASDSQNDQFVKSP
jgi:hypothetical protein